MLLFAITLLFSLNGAPIGHVQTANALILTESIKATFTGRLVDACKFGFVSPGNLVTTIDVNAPDY